MITIYDFESSVPGTKSFSPFVAKVRIALNYKKLPHRSVFLKSSEIKERAQVLGLPTNDVDGDAVPRHKVPIIHDESTGQFVSDSTRILAYLDKTYPDTPSLLPAGTEATAVALDEEVNNKMLERIYPSIGTRLVKALGDEKTVFFRPFVESLIGMTVEAYLADPEIEAKTLKSAEEGFSAIDKIFRKAALVSGGESNSGKLTYAEVSAGSTLFYVRACYLKNEDLWKRLEGWDGGRWGRLYQTLLPYTAVPEE